MASAAVGHGSYDSDQVVIASVGQPSRYTRRFVHDQDDHPFSRIDDDGTDHSHASRIDNMPAGESVADPPTCAWPSCHGHPRPREVMERRRMSGNEMRESSEDEVVQHHSFPLLPQKAASGPNRCTPLRRHMTENICGRRGRGQPTSRAESIFNCSQAALAMHLASVAGGGKDPWRHDS